MGSLFKTKGQSVTDPGAQEAWNMSKPFQQQALTGMGTVAAQVAANPAYAGQRVAGLNNFQTGSANTLGTFAGNTAGLAQNFLNVGQGNMNAASGFGTNAQDIFGRASGDPTQQIIAQAGMYADNPYVTGMIDAASRDVMRSLTEQQLPSLARGFAGTGNTNSTRAGVESAIAQRGAMDRMNDTAAGIRSSLFGSGLDMAQRQYNQNLENMLTANQGLLQAGEFGGNMLGAGQNFATNAFTQGQAAGGVDYGYQQALLDAEQAKFNESWQNPLAAFQALNQGASNAANIKTSAGVITQPSVASQIAAVGQAAASGYGAYKGR